MKKNSKRYSSFKEIGADRLAYECAKMIVSGYIDPRSGIGDALIDYLEIGMPDAPQDVHTWMRTYEKESGGDAL